MGELTDKIKGNANEAAGKVKQQSNDPETRADGRAQEAEGKGQQLKGEVKGKMGDDI
ncbi:CsbD family protein [Croceicoccus hydrothermalis]|uniref:CsbD family protein n=1 Tax=Croceicoccus hydrothermalis TaxID=2867964 RepID=UPI001EFBD580|nr:CsbD family protein [Croceicoccus hydrothermalis]